MTRVSPQALVRSARFLILHSALLSGTVSGQQLRSLDPPVLLPDGSEFKTWEQPLHFSRTYYVNARHPKASDDNPGTEESPFATINKAAQVLQPGERVVVSPGVYRERVRPARGGTAPDKMISYEAQPGTTVVIKGSRVFHPEWNPTTLPGGSVRVWHAKLAGTLFDGYNPFDIDNVTSKQFDVMEWAQPLRGKPPYTLVRGLVFQDGRLLRQVVQRDQLTEGGGTWWVDRPKQELHVRLFDDKAPTNATIELTTQETIFAPDSAGLGFIRVKGFTIEHAAGPFPWEQVGAISTTRGHHWIIEDNTVRWANGVGIDLGIQMPGWPQPPVVGFHIVRRNIVTDCGVCGICGLGPGRRNFGLLIQDNLLTRNAFYDVERLFETAGIKTHNNVRCLIRRNLVVDTPHGPGIWMDWNNQFSRCCQNVIIRAATMHGGIFVEASYQPNLIDQNVVWETTGHGIYEHDSTGQIFAHNLIAKSSKSGFHLHGRITDRRVDGREMVYGRHKVLNNLLAGNAQPDEFRGDPSELANNVSAGTAASLDLQTLSLTWSLPGGLAPSPAVPGVTHDFYGRPRPAGTAAMAGLFAELPTASTPVRLWPLTKEAPVWPLKLNESLRR